MGCGDSCERSHLFGSPIGPRGNENLIGLSIAAASASGRAVARALEVGGREAVEVRAARRVLEDREREDLGHRAADDPHRDDRDDAAGHRQQAGSA